MAVPSIHSDECAGGRLHFCSRSGGGELHQSVGTSSGVPFQEGRRETEDDGIGG
jgi:hypothetical protein